MKMLLLGSCKLNWFVMLVHCSLKSDPEATSRIRMVFTEIITADGFFFFVEHIKNIVLFIAEMGSK